MSDGTRDRIAQYADLHPDAGVIEALGELTLSPAQWRDVVADALEADDPYAAVATTDDCKTGDCMVDDGAPEGESPSANPAHDAGSENANQQPTPEDGGSLVSDSTVSGENDEDSAEEAGSPGVTPTPEADESADKYRRVYLDAVDRADREPWEFVEEGALREALDAIGFAQLLDNGDLRHVSDWRVADVSDDDERPRRRWYYPSGSEPRPDEFRRFHQLLTEAAPEGYEPHYFRVAKAGKDPATQYGSWKTPDARLTADEAVEWMHEGGNVGIAGTPEDALINVDIDDDEATTPEDVPTSLRARSRSRTGWHTWYFDQDGDVPNIPTDEFGEIRTDWQYVVAPGSFVASTSEEIPDAAVDPGYYTVEDEEPVARIGYDDLPDVFHEAAEAAQDDGETVDTDETTSTYDPADAPDSDDRSAVFDVEAADLVNESDASERFGSIFHSSSTGANMSVSNGKLHCWRHGVAHGGLQALATLSDEITEGCRELGAAHKNSGAGRNRLKGDWELVWAAWHEAKDRGAIPTDDPVPYRALRELAVDDGLLDREDLVERDTDDGSYTAFPDAETYNAALDHVHEEYGVDPGREPAARGREADDSAEEEYLETDRDLLDLDVVVEPANALAAAEAVEPDDLGKDLPELKREDVDDVAIAVAIAEGRIDGPREFPTDGGYTEAYYRARDHYGAPLPKYLDNSTLEEREDLVFAALERVGPQHILGSTRSDITVGDPEGVAFAKLNPTWEDSESGERILAGYGPGFYCVEHDVTFSPIQFVALEHELIATETEYPRGEAFKQAYRLLREEYGAPLPKWRATLLEHVAVLPPAVNLLGDSGAGPTLEDAHEQTETLLRDAVSVRDRAQLLTNLPGTGKTFSTAIIGAERPILYLAHRNELKQQMADYCQEVREDDEDHPDAEPTARHLPIFAENQLPDEVILDAVRAIEEENRNLLQDPEALLDRVDVPEDWDEDDEDAIDLPRESCPAANGEHGLGWALAVQTVRALAQTPQEIHTRDTAIFGDELPCQHDGDCSYTLGWEAVRQPEAADVLIGSPGHAYVGSATTYFEPDGDGGTNETPRAVVLDEFPGDAYMTEYGDRYLDHATWLADALVGVGTREDLTRADLETDTWVNHWLDGDGGELADVGEAIDALNAGAALCDARDEAADLLDSGRLDSVGETSANLAAVRDALEALAGNGPTDADLGAIAAQLRNAEPTVRAEADNAYATDGDHAGVLYRLADRLDSVLTSLSVATERDEDLLDEVERTTDALDVGGDLRRLLDDAVAALQGKDQPEALLDVAVTALQGGRDGCRELAIFAEDGYAHPDAWALLAGAIAEDVPEVETGTYAFDGDDGGRFKHLEKNGATIAGDKDQHGALVADRPAFTDITGSKCPLIGLDATGRTDLWRFALGRDTQRRDIHDSDAERRRFLRDAMNLTVVQTTGDPLPYHGNPDGKNFAEDLELVKEVAEELTGRGADTLDDDAPAVISTLKVLNHLEDELGDLAGDTVNYENMKGSDALGDRLVSIILGSCHFGDAAPEKWGLLAGEDAGRGDTRGETLDYGSDVANTFLKHMREDYTMQAILRAGRNDEASVVFAHTSALRDDLPVDEEAAVLSAHSKGTLAVAEAAKDLRGEPFTANDVVEAIAEDERAVGRRQVQNVLADLREGGYLRVVEEGGPGVGYEYELDEDPGLADVDLPEPDVSGDTVAGGTYENPANREQYTWNFVSRGDKAEGSGLTPPTRPTIPAQDTATATADGVEPPG